MTNIVLNNIGSLQETTSAQSSLNANNQAIVVAVEASVPITGTTMAGIIDMNSNRILNLPAPSTADEPLRLQDLSNFNGGGTVTNIPANGISGEVLTSNGSPYMAVWESIPSLVGSPLTATSDTNVTLSLSGTASTALLNSVGLSAGWQGTLASGRLNSNVVQSVTSDTNVTGSITSQALTLGWTGTLAAGRLNSNVVQSVTAGPNITASIANQALTVSFTGSSSVSTRSVILNASGSGAITLFPYSTASATGNILIPSGGSATLLSTAGTVFSGALGNGITVVNSTTKMAGLGAFFSFTPTYSTRAKFLISGSIFSNSASQNNAIQMYYGTGTAPTAGAAVTGTALGASMAVINQPISSFCPVVVNDIATGLVPGVAYWVDLAYSVAAGAGTTYINTAGGLAHEI